MSSDEVDKKSEDDTKELASSAEESETKEDAKEEKVNSKPAAKKKGAEPTKIKQPAKKRMKTEQAEKETKKVEKKKAPKAEEDSEEEEEVENHKAVPLLDQPLEVSGSRKRKEVERFVPKAQEEEKKDSAVVIVKGKGVALGRMEVVEHAISRARPETLKLLHKFCFNKVGKQTDVKPNLLKFNGWDFEEGSDDFEKKKVFARGIKKVLVSHLKEVCTLLDIEKSGSRDDIMDRILSYLVSPIDSGRKLNKGRSKRKGALSKNYTEGGDENDKKESRKKRGKPKKTDEDGTEESDLENGPEKKIKQNDKEKANNSTEESEHEEEEEKEKEEKPTKKGGKKGKKAAEAVAEKKAPPKKRAAAKKAAEKTDSEGAAEGDDESEGDEPESKKAKTPPTDEDIKTYVKSLLEGANLELITMKKVCQDVYAHYPDFDLSSKKDFIKTTVKALISS